MPDYPSRVRLFGSQEGPKRCYLNPRCESDGDLMYCGCENRLLSRKVKVGKVLVRGECNRREFSSGGVNQIAKLMSTTIKTHDIETAQNS